MKYYIVTLHEQNGEYEYSTPVLTVRGNKDKPEDEIHDYILDYYDSNSVDDCGDYVTFNCGDVAVSLYKYEQISKQDYKLLDKYI